MQKMPPAIFTGTVFGLLQSFGLVLSNTVGGPFIENFALFCQFRVCLVGVTGVWGESGKRTRVARTAGLTCYRYATQPFF